MNKLNQESIDKLVNDIDHYRRAQAEFSGMEIMAKDALLKIMTSNKLKVVYTSDNRRICFDDRAVKVERQPRY